jgi:putative DNA primase/helicase
MTTFIDFCRLHDVIIDTLPPVGVWKRYKTVDKPMHRNGAVKYMGTHGFVQNHATAVEVSLWQDTGMTKIARQEVSRIALEASRETIRMNAQAADKAGHMLRQCRVTTHAYLAAKGFPDEVANVLDTDNGPLCLIPMRIGRDVVGVQQISESGDKKFLYGQRSGHAQFVLGGSGPHYLTEGYATALSARQALGNLKRKFTLHVCFSAGNMVKVASALQGGVILADNDASGTGERVAKQIGWPYWMSPSVGEDFNDFAQRVGTFAAAQSLGKVRAPMS